MNNVTRLIIALFVLITTVFIISNVKIGFEDLTATNIKTFLSKFGMIKASMLFIGIYAFTVRPFIPVPPTLYTVAGGLVFGPLLGTALSVTGATLNAAITFLFSRFMGKKYVEKLFSEATESINKNLMNKDFKTILILRSLPVGPPFDLISYAAGLLNVSFGKYFLATFTGIIPATFVISYFGNSISDGNIIILFGFILFVVFSFFISRLLSSKRFQNLNPKIDN